MKGPSEFILPGQTKQGLARENQRHREIFSIEFFQERQPYEIFFNGLSIEHWLIQHQMHRDRFSGTKPAFLWGADLFCANLRNWDLSGVDFSLSDFHGADLSGACLNATELHGVRGNGKEIKSAHFGQWPVVWTRCPDYGDYIHVGCHRHHYSKWEKGDERWLRRLSRETDLALKMWDEIGEAILNLVKSSPALPWSHVSKGGGNPLIGSGSDS